VKKAGKTGLKRQWGRSKKKGVRRRGGSKSEKPGGGGTDSKPRRGSRGRGEKISGFVKRVRTETRMDSITSS